MNKRSLMVMVLIGLLGFGMVFGGCENGTTDNNGSTPPTEKVVAEKYRGTWKWEGQVTEIFVLTEKNLTFNDDPDHPRDVYTIDNKLYEKSQTYSYYELYGTFTDDNTLVGRGITYLRQ